MKLIFLALLGTACSGKVDDPAGDDTGGAGNGGGNGGGNNGGGGGLDADNDGWFDTKDGDCDDSNPTIYPGAPEQCNGLDDNCDGVIDEGVVSGDYYPDEDGDGYGTQDPDTGYQPEEGCDPPPGFAIGQTDCDDGNPNINPDADEVCDDLDVDENCNGISDNNDGTALEHTKSLFYPDLDGDGYGPIDGEGRLLCEGNDVYYTTSGDDCNDADKTVNPGVAEYCDDGVDNDCSGTIDICEAAGEYSLERSEARKLTGGSAGVSLGITVASVGDVSGDSNDDVVLGMGDEAYLLFGPISSRATASSVAATQLTNLGGDLVGIGSGGDLNGDGKDELALGVPSASSGAGTVWIVDGAASYSSTTSVSGLIGISGSSGDGAGADVVGGFDVSGSSLLDVVVGAPGSASGDGAAYVMFGPITSSRSVTLAGLTITGATGQGLGNQVAVGDLDGDGNPDLVVAAESIGNGGFFVFDDAGLGSGSVDVGDADASFNGASGSGLGTSLVLGDVDGDGKDDVIVGAPDVDGSGTTRGAVYTVLGPASTSGTLPGAADGQITGTTDGERIGFSVASSDFDGDGNDDVLVGAADSDHNWLFLGPTTSTVDTTAAETTFVAEDSGDRLGVSVAGGFDQNGDGFEDLLLGVPNEGTDGTDAGAAYLILGR